MVRGFLDSLRASRLAGRPLLLCLPVILAPGAGDRAVDHRGLGVHRLPRLGGPLLVLLHTLPPLY